MISILIPVYNFDVSELVLELINQGEKLELDFEIICLNDASSSKKPEIKSDHFIWQENESNLGRAFSRNKLAEKAKFNAFLFLDADTMPKESDFLKAYRSALNKGHNVICGGIDYQKTPPSLERVLRWNYGKRYEAIKASRRKKDAYSSFMSGNFLISKDKFDQIKFDDELSLYGHEDTLFGKHLLEYAIPIHHIENNIYHLGLENNLDFLNKTHESIKHLNQLYNSGKITRHYSSVIKLFENLKTLRLLTLVNRVLSIFKKKFHQSLSQRGTGIWKLQLLKLKWFIDERTN